jgi:hypothetical protein
MPAVPIPRTWAVNDNLSAARLNTELRDLANFALEPPWCRLTRASTLPLTTGNYTVLTWPTETSDTYSLHDPTQPSRINIAYDGEYELISLVSIAANTTGVRGVQWRKNAAATPGSGTLVGETHWYQPFASSLSQPDFQYDRLTAGDHVEVFNYQNSGTTLNANPGWVIARWTGR